jgi:hypothetical protein
LLKQRLYKSISVFVWLFCFLMTAEAQEAVRMSLASAEAAAARRKAGATLGYYNLGVGPTAWRFGASLGVEYSDNVSLGAANEEGDVVFRPQINTEMLWPITDKNALNLNVGVGYSAYVNHPEFNRVYITPGSELSFDLYVGDFWINLHDRFSISENSYQDPTVTGTANYSRLENALGAATTWDLNKVVARGGYDHVNYTALSGNSGQPDGESELLSASVGYAFMPATLAGIEAGGGFLSYSGSNVIFTTAKQWNAGVFWETQVSQYIHVRGSVGYTGYEPENSQTTNVVGDFNGLYAQVELQHRVNQFVDYTLSGGRTISFAFYGGAVDLIYARLAANWRVMRKVGLGTTFNYEHGSEGTFSAETFDRYGGSIGLSRTITKKATASLGYQIYWRTSDVAGRDYLNNVVSLNVSYTF